jgi:hypothetical protein
MPVRYDIAAQVPQASAGPDIMNMMAQYQAMGYRQQQNALAQMQMQEYQRQMQAGAAMRGLASEPGFNIADPRLVGRAFELGGPEEGVRIANTQRQLAALQAQQEAQAATAKYHTGMLDIARAKLPLEEKKLASEVTKEERYAREALSKADSAALDLGIKRTASAQDLLAQYDPSSSDTWPSVYESLKQTSPEFAARFSPNKPPDQKLISAAMRNADMVRRVAEDTIRQRTQLEFAAPQTPAFAPGYIQRYDPTTNSFYLEAPRQPGAMPAAANAMVTPPSAMPQNAFTGQPMTPMTPAAPVAPAVPVAPAAEEPPAPGRIKPTAAPMPPIGTPEYEVRRSARSVLDIAGVDLDKGTNRVADLIKNTPSSAFRAYAQQKTGAFAGKATPEMENVGRLNTIIDNMVLAAANNKLGGQVSDADVRLLKEAQAQINDPSVQPNQRLAAWDEVLRIKAKQAGYSYTPMDLSQIRAQPIIGERKPAQQDESAILTDIFGSKK